MLTEPLDQKTPIVTLWLPKVKSTKAVAVYGGSGRKYLFQRSAAAQGRPARPYFDAATFEAEESDIRANLRHLYAVCTLLAPSEPAAPAMEADEAPEPNTSPKPNTSPEKENAPDSPAAPVTRIAAEAPGAGASHSSATPLPPASSSDAPAKAWAPKESYTDVQLHEMPMEDLRALAAHYRVPGTHRREIVRAWVKRP